MAEKGPSQTPSEENPPVAKGKQQFNQIYMPRYSLNNQRIKQECILEEVFKKNVGKM